MKQSRARGRATMVSSTRAGTRDAQLTLSRVGLLLLVGVFLNSDTDRPQNGVSVATKPKRELKAKTGFSASGSLGPVRDRPRGPFEGPPGGVAGARAGAISAHFQ